MYVQPKIDSVSPLVDTNPVMWQSLRGNYLMLLMTGRNIKVEMTAGVMENGMQDSLVDEMETS